MEITISIMTRINRVLLGITLALYITIFFGMYSQIVLGAYQVLTAIILIFLFKSIPKINKKRLLFYWVSVIAYGLIWITDLFDNSNDFWILFYILIPMSLAAYFTMILESLKKQTQ